MKQRTPATAGQTPPLLWGLLGSPSAPETPGGGTAIPGRGEGSEPFVSSFVSSWSRSASPGWWVVCACAARVPAPPVSRRRPSVYVFNGKNPTTTPHLFSPRSNLPLLPALQTSPLQANASPRGHSVAPAPRPLPPSHRLFASCAFISTQLPGGQKRRASLQAQRSRCCGRGCQGKA